MGAVCGAIVKHDTDLSERCAQSLFASLPSLPRPQEIDAPPCLCPSSSGRWVCTRSKPDGRGSRVGQQRRERREGHSDRAPAESRSQQPTSRENRCKATSTTIGAVAPHHSRTILRLASHILATGGHAAVEAARARSCAPPFAGRSREEGRWDTNNTTRRRGGGACAGLLGGAYELGRNAMASEETKPRPQSAGPEHA